LKGGIVDCAQRSFLEFLLQSRGRSLFSVNQEDLLCLVPDRGSVFDEQVMTGMGG
jgi:hypothetical protein